MEILGKAPVATAGTHCQIPVSAVHIDGIIPYLALIVYEASKLLHSILGQCHLMKCSVILSLTAWRITRWRETIPAGAKLPLIDTLWDDGWSLKDVSLGFIFGLFHFTGVVYFSLMLLSGVANIAFTLQVVSPQTIDMGLIKNLSSQFVCVLAPTATFSRHPVRHSPIHFCYWRTDYLLP